MYKLKLLILLYSGAYSRYGMSFRLVARLDHKHNIRFIGATRHDGRGLSMTHTHIYRGILLISAGILFYDKFEGNEKINKFISQEGIKMRYCN